MGVKRRRQRQGERGGVIGEEVRDDPWVVNKKLTKSDLNNLSRLLLPGDQVEEHVLPFLNDDELKQLKEEESGGGGDGGLQVWVKDLDDRTWHVLSFNRWKSNGSYKLGRKWISNFVRKRNLRREDEIGMFWDNSITGYSTGGFCFSVIKRCPPPPPDAAADVPSVVAATPPPNPSLCKFARKYLRLSPPMPDDP